MSLERGMTGLSQSWWRKSRKWSRFCIIKVKGQEKFVLRFRLSFEKCIFPLHFIFRVSTAGLYIPPEYTRYSSDEAFNQIEHELHSFSTNSKYVGLLGDFNSRTGEDDDYVNVNFEHGDNNVDEFIENHAGILENLNTIT
jgi:hypothetical protein